MQLYRAGGLIHKDKVSSTKIAFIGVGSLGSLTIANLALPWEHVILVDPETLAPENIERHVLGVSQIGRPKALAMIDWLVDRGLDRGSIEAFFAPAESVLDDLKNVDLVIVTTGTTKVCDYVNAWATCPVIYASHHITGRGGEVIVLPNPKRVCYLCAQYALGRESRSTVRACGAPDPEALQADFDQYYSYLRYSVDLIAAYTAHFALRIVGRGDVQEQAFVQANSWHPLMVLPKGGVLDAITPFVETQKGLGLVPHLSLGKEDGVTTLKLRESTMSVRLSQWQHCPLHATQQLFSAEEI